MTKMLALALAAVVAAAVAASASAGNPTKLVASVSDPFSISLTLNGKKVKTLKHGTYKIVVQDKAADHDFHLTGPGVNKATSIAKKESTTWLVVLKKGTYKFVCDPHSSFMKGSFTVK